MEQIKKVTAIADFTNGKLNFTCNTVNEDFEYTLLAITAIRDECQRQIDNKNKCPFNNK